VVDLGHHPFFYCLPVEISSVDERLILLLPSEELYLGVLLFPNVILDSINYSKDNMIMNAIPINLFSQFLELDHILFALLAVRSIIQDQDVLGGVTIEERIVGLRAPDDENSVDIRLHIVS